MKKLVLIFITICVTAYLLNVFAPSPDKNVTVKFYDQNGVLLDQTDYEIGEEITFPEVTVPTGYYLSGWKELDTGLIVTSAKAQRDLEYSAALEPIRVNVTFRYVDGSVETITAIYGVGLEHAQSIPEEQENPPEGKRVYKDYSGNFKDLTKDLTVNYSLRNKSTEIELPIISLK